MIKKILLDKYKKSTIYQKLNDKNQIMNERFSINNIRGLPKECDIIFCNNQLFIADTFSSQNILIFIALKNSLNILNYVIDILTTIDENIEPDKVVLVLGCTDASFPEQTDLRYPIPTHDNLTILDKIINMKCVKKSYISNYDKKLKYDNVYPYPLGISRPNTNNIYISRFQYYLQYDKSVNILERPIGISCFDRVRSGTGQWKDRGIVLHNCRPGNKWENTVNHNNITKYSNKSFIFFLTNITTYPFTLCTHGGGLDPCPKLWEAILCGTIPIINKYSPMSDVFEDFPVVIIDNLTDYIFTLEILKKWLVKYSNYFTDTKKRSEVLDKMSIKYWEKIMRD